MQNALGMRGAKRVGDLDGQFEKDVGRERSAAQLVLERAAFEPLHDDELLAVGFRSFSNVMNRADVRMVQRRGRLRFALKTAHRLSVSREFRGEKLQGDSPTEAQILGAEHHTHAATAQTFDDAVPRDRVPNSRRHRACRAVQTLFGPGPVRACPS